MDFEQNDSRVEPTQPAISGGALGQPYAEQIKKGAGWKILLGIILALSVIANVVLFLTVVGVIALFSVAQRGVYAEQVLQQGPRSTKIAVISLQGIIDGEQAKDLSDQLKMAETDKRVKGVIIRVNSPGGTISGSDQIHNAIRKFRDEAGKPTVAFMEGMAASGGYYTSVACEQIVAEPTTITGSIGVMFGHFVLEQLLEEKLGIEPVIITSGRKKGWPSMFQAFTDEQRQYVQEKLIAPAYKRFVQIVDEGRPSLTLAEVEGLADGGIYGAQDALEEKLIDKIGYFDEAVELVKSLAGIEKAQVVQYRKPFSFARFLSYQSRSSFKLDRTTLYELSMPQVLYLWSIQQ
jgi:protease-4